MFIEQLYYRGLGVKKEFPELNPLAAGLMTAKSIIYTKKHHSIIEGGFPTAGAAIFAGNHHSEADVYKICQASRITAGRLPSRAVVRMSLIRPNSQESAKYLASIGNKQDNLNKYNAFRAFVLKGIGVYGIMRDNPGLDFVRWGDAILKTDQMLGIFLQPSRDEECSLRNLQSGAAFFAKRHPDIPIYLFACSGSPAEPDKLTILEPITYAKKSKEVGRQLSLGEFTIIMADMVAAVLPKRSQLDWETRRETELTRLTASSNRKFP